MGIGVTQAELLRHPVFAADGYKPFGDFTLLEVRSRAAELADAAGWGPTARVGAVARAWSELARAMAQAGAARVGDLDGDALAPIAARLWVVPPGGSLL